MAAAEGLVRHRPTVRAGSLCAMVDRRFFLYTRSNDLTASRRFYTDLVGLEQATDDILVHYGVIEDDNSRIVAGHDGSRVRYDKDNPRVEITIGAMED